MMSFVDKVAGSNGLRELAVLECGSLNVNGSVRDLFSGEYVGVDLREGPGVDRVADCERLPWEEGIWPVVVSCEMLEHTLRPHVIVAEMARVLSPGGWLICTARGFDEWGCFRYHGHPDDHHRWSRQGFVTLFADAGLEVVSCHADPVGPGWLLVARKPLRDVYRMVAS